MFVLRFQTSLAKAERHYHNRACYNAAKKRGGLADEAAKKTALEKYGVACTFQSEQGLKKTRETMLKRYGVEHAMQSREIALKSIGPISNAERRFSKTLDELYPNDVETPKFVNGWKVDFYVKTLETYIQFDGVYWHGLDRDFDILRECKTRRDKVILATHQRDRRQNEWFAKQGLRLVRITDVEFESMTPLSLRERLETHTGITP